jgi:small-conductance mechanosensitive channel
VLEVNDLYTQLVTPSHTRVYIPNYLLLKNFVSNLSKSQGVDVTVSFSLPLREDLESVLERIRKAIADDVREEGVGEPVVRISALDRDSVEVELKLRLVNPQRVEEACLRILWEVYRAVRGLQG